MYKFVAFIISIFVVFYSCNSNTNPQNNDKMENITLKGKFQSLQGVMNDVSCYCFNVGYLTTQDGKEVVVCFDEIKDANISCSDILVVTGNYKLVKITPEPTSPCPAGEREIFIVKDYKCE